MKDTMLTQSAPMPASLSKMNQYRDMEANEARLSRSECGSPGEEQQHATGSVAASSSHTVNGGSGCSSLSPATVFVAAQSGGIAPKRNEIKPLSTVQPAPRNGHVVTIRINPEAASRPSDNKQTVYLNNADYQCEPKLQKSKVSINNSEPINTIGKFIVSICESGETNNCDIADAGRVRISVNEHKPDNMVQKTDHILKSNSEMSSAYFFCNAFPCSPSNTLISSGQCSPSDTLDSGTCSDLDGTPPPLPKKKLSKSNGTTHKRVSVTVIGSVAHDRTSHNAEVDSEDSESNISCDSLNSSDLSTASLHEDSGVIGFKSSNVQEGDHPAPKMPTLLNGKQTSSGFLPSSLLKDIRDRSAKLSSVPNLEQTSKTSWLEVDKKSESMVSINTDFPIKAEEKLTSFKLVSQVSSDSKKKSSTQPIIVDVTLASPKTIPIVNESTYEDRKQEKQNKEKQLITGNFLYDTDRFYNFHLNENVFDTDVIDGEKKGKKKGGAVSVNGVLCNGSSDCEYLDEESMEYFAGYKDYKNDDAPSTIRSAKGTIRGVKNRVRAGIKTFLQMQDTSSKSYREKDAGKVVVYTTSMGIVRSTYQKCVQVKKILRTLLVKFEERDVFMSGEYQEEIKDRMRSNDVLVPQMFVDGQHIGIGTMGLVSITSNDSVGFVQGEHIMRNRDPGHTVIADRFTPHKTDADTIEKLNECGELRKMLKPYKSADACTTCQVCGGYRLLPCQVCSGSKKSVHRNHFTAEFVALKCMNCDEVGLVKCEAC